jgi:hypothetical protein
VYHRPGTTNKVADALSRLPSIKLGIPGPDNYLNTIDALFAFLISVLQLSDNIVTCIKEGY